MAERVSDPRRWWALAALSMVIVVVAGDVTILNVAIPSFSAALHATATETLWIADVYAFVLAGLLVTMGSLGDRWGRKRMLLVGTAGFAVMSLAAAFAPSALALILGRAAMGVAGATLMPSSFAVIRNTFVVPKERTFAIGVWLAAAAAGESVGPLAAGVLLEHFWWGAAFLINIPLCLLGIALGLFSIRESRNPEPGPLDMPSVATSLVGVLCTVAAIKFLAEEGVHDAKAWALAVVGIAALWWFTRRQLRLPVPMIDMRLFRRRTFSGAVAADTLSILALTGALFYLSLEFQFVDGYSALDTAIRLLPVSACAVISAPTTGRVIKLVGRRLTISGSLALMGVSMVGLSVAGTQTEWVQMASLTVMGIAIGWSFTATAEAIVLSAPPERAGAASAVAETSYEMGSALAFALLGTLLGYVYRTSVKLPDGIPEAIGVQAKGSIVGAVDAAGELPPALAASLLDAVGLAFTEAAVVTAAAAAAVMFVGAGLCRWILPAVDPTPVESVDDAARAGSPRRAD